MISKEAYFKLQDDWNDIYYKNEDAEDKSIRAYKLIETLLSLLHSEMVNEIKS